MARKKITMVKTINKIGKEIVALKIVPLPSSQSLTEEGWPRHKQKYREASFEGADGVVARTETLRRERPPRLRRLLRLRDIFLEAAG